MIVVLLFSIVFAVAFALRNHFQLQELLGDDSANSKWHLWQAVVQGSVVVMLFLAPWLTLHWTYSLLFAGTFWLIFDIMLNAKRQLPWFRPGGGMIDNFFKKLPKPLYAFAKFFAFAIAFFLSWYLGVMPSGNLF